jgi:hypothetical protein
VATAERTRCIPAAPRPAALACARARRCNQNACIPSMCSRYLFRCSERLLFSGERGRGGGQAGGGGRWRQMAAAAGTPAMQ